LFLQTQTRKEPDERQKNGNLQAVRFHMDAENGKPASLPQVQVVQMAGAEEGMEMTEVLTFIEKEELREFERQIETGLKTFRKVGAALLAIRDGRMYRAEFGTFEDYCKDRWGLKKQTAYQMIEGASVMQNLESHNCDALPKNQGQTRPLAVLPPEQQPEAWQAATDKAESEGRKVTAKDVQEQVKKITTKAEIVDVDVLPPEKKEVHKRPIGPPSDGMQFARIAIMNLEQIKTNDAERVEALRVVKDWIIKHEN